MAISYDGQHARAYLDGVLDVREPLGVHGRNPFHYPGSLLKGSADFTVGAVARPSKVESDGQGGFRETGAITANPFTGLLGGLAVFSRALTDSEIHGLATADQQQPHVAQPAPDISPSPPVCFRGIRVPSSLFRKRG